MGLVNRNGNTYFYESKRIGGRVVSRYVGSGAFAQGYAKLDWAMRITARMRRQIAEGERLARVEADRAEQRKARAVRAKLAKEADRIEGYSRRVDAAVEKAMAALGYHRPNRGAWRKRRETTTMGKTRTTTKYDPGALARLVREGEEKALEYFRDNNGDADDSMRRVVVYSLPTVAATKDQPANDDQATAIRAHLILMRDRLAPPGSSEVEILLANRVVLDWLHVTRLEQQIALSHIGHSYARPGASHADRMLSRAHARYTKSLAALAKVRRLATPIVVSQFVGGQHVHGVDAKVAITPTPKEQPQLDKPKPKPAASHKVRLRRSDA
jgi:hypothetical protein